MHSPRSNLPPSTPRLPISISDLRHAAPLTFSPDKMNPIEPSGERKYKGVRRRRWGKWVSEIRVPGTRERLWLGSFSTPEAAAVAHDTAVFFLRGPNGSVGDLNFPYRVAAAAWASLSPSSIQRVASESGMDVDAQLAALAPAQEPQGAGPATAAEEEARHVEHGLHWGR